MKERWEEWRGRWCWIEEKDPPNFCRVRDVLPVRRGDWSDVDADDAKLTVATTRILCLTEAGERASPAAGHFRRAGTACQGRTAAKVSGGVRASDEGRGGEESGEGRGGKEESICLLFTQACPDSALLPSSGGRRREGHLRLRIP